MSAELVTPGAYVDIRLPRTNSTSMTPPWVMVTIYKDDIDKAQQLIEDLRVAIQLLEQS